MLAFEGDSHVEWFADNFAAYEEDKKRRLGIDSVVPHRLKYKQFRGEVTLVASTLCVSRINAWTLRVPHEKSFSSWPSRQ